MEVGGRAEAAMADVEVEKSRRRQNASKSMKELVGLHWLRDGLLQNARSNTTVTYSSATWWA
jgi:hypothetical protein